MNNLSKEKHYLDFRRIQYLNAGVCLIRDKIARNIKNQSQGEMNFLKYELQLFGMLGIKTRFFNILIVLKFLDNLMGELCNDYEAFRVFLKIKMLRVEHILL
ncbi:hypothetical protein BpHYR1_045342 [Brachionus plicatilis]|uniref:Uncharacterized protein n=1 Tax=Brachionus plicatilis TaxID=10195 RepID=A0A3M7SS21_BRAPC|nr:hypothetical protein BpHYR1_045342 [Brachionus plicatilis]